MVESALRSARPRRAPSFQRVGGQWAVNPEGCRERLTPEGRGVSAQIHRLPGLPELAKRLGRLWPPPASHPPNSLNCICLFLLRCLSLQRLSSGPHHLLSFLSLFLSSLFLSPLSLLFSVPSVTFYHLFYHFSPLSLSTLCLCVCMSISVSSCLSLSLSPTSVLSLFLSPSHPRPPHAIPHSMRLCLSVHLSPPPACLFPSSHFRRPLSPSQAAQPSPQTQPGLQGAAKFLRRLR